MPEPKIINIVSLQLKERCKSRQDFVHIMAAVYAVNYNNPEFDDASFAEMIFRSWAELLQVSDFEGEVTLIEVIEVAKKEFLES